MPPIPQPSDRANGALLKMVQGNDLDNGSIGYLAKGIDKAVSKSMIVEPTLRLDRSQEARRRVLICIELFRIMAGDMKWSAQRAADQLPSYLLKKLRGEQIEFSNRASWSGPGNLEGGK